MSTIKERLEGLTNVEVVDGYNGIIEMQKYYAESSKGSGLCPFCGVFRSCHQCPWTIVESQTCCGKCREMFGSSKEVLVVVDEKCAEWVVLRVKQLEKWRRYYLTEINKRKLGI